MEFDTHQRFMGKAIADATNPFTGDPDTKSVTDYIEDVMEMDISGELDQQLKMLHDDLDIVALYRSYLKDREHLTDLDRCGLNLSIEALTTKVNVINNDVISGLNLIAENKFTIIHEILEDTKKYMTYIRYKLPDCKHKSIAAECILSHVDTMQKMRWDLAILTSLHQEIKELHHICTDDTQDTLITTKMHNLFTLLSRLGISIQSKDNVIHLSYDVTNAKEMSFHTLGYQSIGDLLDVNTKLNECLSQLDYHHVFESIKTMESTFTLGVESFNGMINNNEMMIGDTTYVENFTKMLIYKKRFIIMSQILKAALALTNDKVKQFATMIHAVDTGAHITSQQ